MPIITQFFGVFSAEKIKVFESIVIDYLMVGEISKHVISLTSGFGFMPAIS
mgnify:CR=1 FL=1